MNTAIRAAVRLGLDQGHTMLVVRNGFDGLIAGEISECEWQTVDGWGRWVAPNWEPADECLPVRTWRQLRRR